MVKIWFNMVKHDLYTILYTRWLKFIFEVIHKIVEDC